MPNVIDYHSLRRDFTNRRNAEKHVPTHERLTTLVNNAEGMLKDPSPELEAMFHENARGLYAYEARRAGRA